MSAQQRGKVRCNNSNAMLLCPSSIVFYSCIIDEAINDHDHSCLQRRQAKAQAKQASEGHCVLTTLHCLVMKVELTSCGIANFCRVTSSIPYKATFCQLDTKVSIRLSSYIWTGFSSPQQELTLLTKIFCVWRCYNDVQFVL